MNDWSYWSLAQYGEPLAQALTAWLYGDKAGNPATWAQPEHWPQAGRVAFVERSLTFALAATQQAGSGLVLPLDLGGGSNVLVLAREVAYTVGGTTTNFDAESGVPNNIGSKVFVKIEREDEVTETPAGPVHLFFGERGRPVISPAPEMYKGSLARNVTMQNGLSNPVTVTLTWYCAILDTGR